MLFFIAKDDSAALRKVAEVMAPYKGKIPYNKIETQAHAGQVKKEAHTHSNGVFFMKSTLGRGIDFRFAKDAYVLVLNYDNLYGSSNCTQMVGRSNRAQGIQAGHIFCNDEVVMNDEPGFMYLQGRDKQLGEDLGPEIAGALTTTWDSLGENDKNTVSNYFKAHGW